MSPGIGCGQQKSRPLAGFFHSGHDRSGRIPILAIRVSTAKAGRQPSALMCAVRRLLWRAHLFLWIRPREA